MVKDTVESDEWRVRREPRQAARWLGLVLSSMLLVSGYLPPLFGQQPQAQGGQPVYSVNAKYVQGVGPGYWPTAGSGLALNLTSGTAYCGAPPALVSYAGGSLTLTANATNYVYLDPAANCAPGFNTSGFVAGQIPLAKVSTGASSIASVTDARNWFTPLPCAMSPAGAATCSSLGANQDLNLTPSGTGRVEVSSGGTTAQELTATDDGSHWLQMLNLYTTGGIASPLTVPVISFQNKTYNTYLGDIEGDSRGGLIFYGAGVNGYTTLEGDGEVDILSGNNKNIRLTPGGTGSVLLPRLNNVRYADQFAGSNAGAKIAACIADLPSTGGTCDARGLQGAQTISQNIFAGVTKPVRLLFGHATFTVTVAQVALMNYLTIEGAGRWATIFQTGAAIDLLTLGDSTHHLTGPVIRECQFDGNSATGTNGINIVNATDGLLENVVTEYFSANGVYFSANNSPAYFWVFRKLTSRSNSGWGVLEADGNAGALSLYDCVLSTNTSGGGQFSSNNVQIYGGEIGDNGGSTGALFFAGNYGGGTERYGVVVSGVYWELNTAPAEIRFASSSVTYHGVVISGNKFTSPNSYGIWLTNGSGPGVAGIAVIGNAFANHTVASLAVNGNITGGSFWPNDFQDPAIRSGGTTTPAQFLMAGGTLNFTSISPQTCQEQVLTLTGATTSGVASASPSASLGNTNLSWSAWVSAANTVSVRVCNPTTGNITPTAVTWYAKVVQ